MEQVLPGIWTALIAVVSGAGGAALLELWLKPKRLRRSAAIVLAAEVVQNGIVLALHLVSGKKHPLWIAHDFRLSVIGFQSIADRVSELPPKVVRRTLLLYGRFDELNQAMTRYWELSRLCNELADDDPRRDRMESYLDEVLAVFHGRADTAFKEAKAVLPMLKAMGQIEEEPDAENNLDDFPQNAEKFFEDRRRKTGDLSQLRQHFKDLRERSRPGHKRRVDGI